MIIIKYTQIDYSQYFEGEKGYDFFKRHEPEFLLEFRAKGCPPAFKNNRVWERQKELTVMECRECGEVMLTYSIDFEDEAYANFIDITCDNCGSRNVKHGVHYSKEKGLVDRLKQKYMYSQPYGFEDGVNKIIKSINSCKTNFDKNYNKKENNIMKTTEVIQIDLTKDGFDLSKSEWKSGAKPIKAFLTLKEGENNDAFKFSFEICDMIFLMEDGTFQRADNSVDVNRTELGEAVKKKFLDATKRFAGWTRMMEKLSR